MFHIDEIETIPYILCKEVNLFLYIKFLVIFINLFVRVLNYLIVQFIQLDENDFVQENDY